MPDNGEVTQGDGTVSSFGSCYFFVAVLLQLVTNVRVLERHVLVGVNNQGAK